MSVTHSLDERSRDSALAMLQAARLKAGELGVAVCICIVSPQGVPLASYHPGLGWWVLSAYRGQP
ncbi:hypothetical protein [Candidatus Thalassolituus haligoni]|uniref:hypothetical protein n=1 Tax=Candidatus Thalassolituus haligoni TaxID=3100113 RepID=UPI00351161D8